MSRLCPYTLNFESEEDGQSAPGAKATGLNHCEAQRARTRTLYRQPGLLGFHFRSPLALAAGVGLILIVCLLPTHIALAHPGQPIAPHDLWSSWNTNTFLLVSLELTLLLYLWGIRNVWRQAGIGSGITVRRCLMFIVAIVSLVIALISPLDALSGALFSAHMAQHFVLILVTAPLLVMSDVPLVMLWALPRRYAHSTGQLWNRIPMLRRAWHLLTHPFTAWLLFAVTLWLWHTPVFYESALRNESIHAVEHLAFLITAMLFWWVILDPSRPKHIRYGIAIPYLFTTALHSGILGALMTFTSQAWYPFYAASVASWGLTALQDQQLAGLLMWLPGGAVFILLAIGYFGLWLHSLEQRASAI